MHVRAVELNSMVIKMSFESWTRIFPPSTSGTKVAVPGPVLARDTLPQKMAEE